MNFVDLNHTFKVNWIKRLLGDPYTIWNFIPYNIFNQIGGIPFLLLCDYTISKLPIKLSKFHQQALLSWKICYLHNFSPHSSFLWNNCKILSRNKSRFLQKWYDRGIKLVLDVLDSKGDLLIYENFMSKHCFPVPFKEF